jgi:hypothetical protein
MKDRLDGKHTPSNGFASMTGVARRSGIHQASSGGDVAIALVIICDIPI